MPVAMPLALDGWSNFYVIMGGASAALTGLMFVVVTLMARRDAAPSQSAHHAFGTPIVIHFTFVLLLAGVLTMPGHTTLSAAAACGLISLAGIGHLTVSAILMRRQNDYQPVAADWIWYVIAPSLAYAMTTIAAMSILWHPAAGLYAIAAGVMAQLFVGIHNAWDTATYIAVTVSNETRSAASRDTMSADTGKDADA